MNSRTNRTDAQPKPNASRFLANLSKALLPAALVLALTAVSAAKDLPDAPSVVAAGGGFAVQSAVPVRVQPRAAVESKPVDATFVSLALISTGSTFADSYTTLFARENWLAGKKNVCNIEVQSAYLYGTHPTVVRSYAVASVKSVGAVAAAYYLRKHHSKLWTLPLLGNAAISLEGVTQNMIACN